MRFLSLPFILLIVALTAPARAAGGLDAAERLYTQGDYNAAIAAGRGLATADGFGLAARAGLVMAGYLTSGEEQVRYLDAALDDAGQALARVPGHVEGHLQMAIALGYRARLTRSVEDVRQARVHVTAALDAAPDDPWANAALGGWHGEVVIEAGGFIGGLLFGASRRRAARAFQAALDRDPDNVALHVGYAGTLLRFGRSRYRDDAIALLTRARTLTPRTAFDRMMLDHAGRLLVAAQGNGEDMRVALAAITPFGQVQ